VDHHGTARQHTALYAALFGNLAIAITKFIADGITGGSAMLSEGMHSLADSGNEVLLLYAFPSSRCSFEANIRSPPSMSVMWNGATGPKPAFRLAFAAALRPVEPAI